jgi:hypothetical protein
MNFLYCYRHAWLSKFKFISYCSVKKKNHKSLLIQLGDIKGVDWAYQKKGLDWEKLKSVMKVSITRKVVFFKKIKVQRCCYFFFRRVVFLKKIKFERCWFCLRMIVFLKKIKVERYCWFLFTVWDSEMTLENKVWMCSSIRLTFLFLF